MSHLAKYMGQKGLAKWIIHMVIYAWRMHYHDWDIDKIAAQVEAVLPDVHEHDPKTCMVCQERDRRALAQLVFNIGGKEER